MTSKPCNLGDCRMIIARELNKVVADPKMHIKDLIFAKQFRGLGNYSGASSIGDSDVGDIVMMTL